VDRILDVSGLTKIYGAGCESCLDLTGPEAQTNQCSACGSVVACQDVEFKLSRGEILGIIGESGSGKSTLVRLAHMEEEPTAGCALLFDRGDETDLFTLNAAQQRWLRNHRLGMVYQNAHRGLDFGLSSGGNIAERLLMSDIADYGVIRRRARKLLSRTEVPADRMDETPRHFSGGMQQRVQIAKALATDPPLLFLDEVTTGLDLTVQAKILDLILEIQQELQIAMIVVTHDLGVVRLLAARTMVMKYGKIVESGLTDQILEDPQDPYTQLLVSSSL